MLTFGVETEKGKNRRSEMSATITAIPISQELSQRMKHVIPPKKQWSPVDEALYGVTDIFYVEKNKAESLRWEALKYAFSHHYHNNEFYRRFCQNDGITPDDLKSPADLSKIPLIPDTFFKDYPQGDGFLQWLGKVYTGTLPEIRLKNNPSFQDAMEALYEQGVTVTFTSGTSGRFSFFPRNKLTWMRQQYSFACACLDILGKRYDPERILMQVAPNPRKTFIYIGKVMEIGYRSVFAEGNIYYLLDREITPDTIRIAKGLTHGVKERVMFEAGKFVQKRTAASFVKRLQQFARENKRIVLAGAPSVMYSVISTMEEKGERLNLSDNSIVATGGGWKLPAGAPISNQQFREKIHQMLGVPDERCRDLYGMSECSAFFMGCEGHYKHIPHSILYPMVLGDDMKSLGYGQYGRFAFLDPLADSYPGFIITGDRVKILESCPVCKRIGPVIESDVSRMTGTEDRGCSTTLGQMFVKQMSQESRR
jgi:phenylacetate-coenzyme A ligase PaaK-like adenylate-forming protein